MRVVNIWELKVPVIIEYQGKKITIPYDNYIYFLPDELRSHNFKGLLRVVPDDVPLKKHYPKLFEFEKDSKTHQIIGIAKSKAPEPKEAFPEFVYKEPDFSEFANLEPPQNPEYFPTYMRDKDDPNILVKKEPTLDDKRKELKNGEKPLKKIKIDKKVREEARKARLERIRKQVVTIS